MGYYVSNMIGIRTGGVFGGETDMNDLAEKIQAVVNGLASEADQQWSDIQPSMALATSAELVAHKGAYVVIAGVFNYWSWDKSSEFSRRLSKACGVEVMHMCWDEQKDEVQCQVWLAGNPLFEASENPIGQILRRIL